MNYACLFTKANAVTLIESCIKKHGGAYSEWYVGTTNDPLRCLYDQHNVNPADPAHVIIQTRVCDAHHAENHYLRLGCDGGDCKCAQPCCVFAYKKCRQTIE